jgi:hypothetical protein
MTPPAHRTGSAGNLAAASDDNFGEARLQFWQVAQAFITKTAHL